MRNYFVGISLAGLIVIILVFIVLTVSYFFLPYENKEIFFKDCKIMILCMLAAYVIAALMVLAIQLIQIQK